MQDDLRSRKAHRRRDGSPAIDANGQPILDDSGILAGRWISPVWAIVDQPDGTKVEGSIPPRYHSAARALATCDFFRSKWDADHDGARFFMVRDRWVEACEAARLHDWESDRRDFQHQREMDERAAEVAAATRKFRDAMAKAPQGSAQKFAHLLWASFEGGNLTDEEARTMTTGVPTAEVLGALDRFADYYYTPGHGRSWVRFGPLFISPPPRRLSPDFHEAALAVELADLFSYWRADTKLVVSRGEDRPPERIIPTGGRVPTISDGTPWKPLAAFVDAAFANTAAFSSPQTRVQAACTAGWKIRGLSNH